MSPHTRLARGVTLIEIAVTISILALMLAAAAPSIGAWMRNTQVRNTASSIVAGLSAARNEAMRRNAPIRFSLVSLADSASMDNSCALSSGGVSWVVSVRDPSSNCQTAPVNFSDTSSVAYAALVADASNPLIVQSQAGGQGGKNVAVAAREADGTTAATTVTFNSFGRLSDTNPIRIIDVKNAAGSGDARRLRVEISPGGLARVCDFDVSANGDPRKCDTTVAFQ